MYTAVPVWPSSVSALTSQVLSLKVGGRVGGADADEEEEEIHHRTHLLIATEATFAFGTHKIPKNFLNSQITK